MKLNNKDPRETQGGKPAGPAWPKRYNYLAAFLTLDCNLRCSYCLNEFGRSGRRRNFPYKPIPGSDWIRGLNRLDLPKDVPVTLEGGEPSLHPDFFQIINGLKPELNIDILTNLRFDVNEFMQKISPRRLRREAPYASIRVSYHPENMSFDELKSKTSALLESGYSVGVWAVNHPAFEAEVLRARRECEKAKIDFRVKDFLGFYRGRLYGVYKYEGSVNGALRAVDCRISELIVGPSGHVFRCHADLYLGRPPVGRLCDENFVIDDVFRPCRHFGACHPCDLKIKTDRHQRFGHTSVEIRQQNQGVIDIPGCASYDLIMRNIPRFIPPLTFKETVSALFSGFCKTSAAGDSMRKFSDAFAALIGVKYAIPAPSGRIALTGLLSALDIPKGKEVILPALTFHAIPAILRDFGLKTRFVDINPSTYCLDTRKLESAVNSSTAAVIPVHLYGRACNMEEITRIANDRGLSVIEDCAQGCGCVYKGKRLGSFGQGGFFSFGPTKNLSALWAGMAVTNSSEVAEKASAFMEALPTIGRLALTGRLMAAMGMRLATRPALWNTMVAPILKVLKNRGVDPIEYLTDEAPGANGKVDTQARLMPRPFQGRIGMSQLAGLDDANRRRIRNGNLLLEQLKGTPGIETAALAPEGENIYMSFVVRVSDRDVFRRRLLSLGIDTHGGNIFSGPTLPGMENAGDGTNATEAVKNMVHLPIYPQLEESDIMKVSMAVKSVLSS